jgi:CheY-like chemotaxis protein/HPt (histidine-containing phosphotransfer) domain-containing protein
MPEMDGLAVAAMIRQRAELSGTRVILLTSGEHPGDQARLHELGIDAHLLKPVPQGELLATIHRVMSRGGAAPASQPPARPPSAAPLRVLVAEDNEFNTRHLERLLRKRGHTVRLAGDGREVLNILHIADSKLSNNDGPPPGHFDVLLLDLHMPHLDGFQVIGALRDWERAAGGHLPVIALTARSRQEDRERCLAAGMDEYLAKPVRAAELFAAIDRVVSAPSPPSPEGIPREAGKRRSLIDPATLLAACGEDAQGLRELCQDFQTYAPGRLDEVRGALRDGDARRLREAAHKLCGLLSAFSTAAGEAASELEDHAGGGRLDEAGPLVARLETMGGELLREVADLTLEDLLRSLS